MPVITIDLVAKTVIALQRCSRDTYEHIPYVKICSESGATRAGLQEIAAEESALAREWADLLREMENNP
jgi:hypothetical protein